ncbi:MAG: hypothetical protein AAF607_15170 [Pseudomonadota bacterium]
MKTSTLSVRVDDNDAAFLAALDIADAHTPSEKLRALLHEERSRRERLRDRVEATEMFADMLRDARRRLRRAETERGVRSEFLAKVYDRLPEIMAAASVGPTAAKPGKPLDLEWFETDTIEEVFVFIREILELGLTTQNRCYDPVAVEKRLEPVLEIVALINLAMKRRKKG